MTYPTRRARHQAEKLAARSRRRRSLTVGAAGLATVAGATIAGVAPAAANDGGVATTDYSAQQGYAWGSDSSSSSGSSYSSGSSSASSSSNGSGYGAAASSASYGTAASTSAASTTAASTTRAAAPAAAAPAAIEVQLASYTSSAASGWKADAAQWATAKAADPSVYYSYGARGSSSAFDCSSFTQAAFAQAGKSIDRTSRAQYAGGQKVSLGNAQVGDLVFWSNNGSGSGIYHVAVYIGDGKIAHARNSSVGVAVTDLHYSPNNMLGTAVRY